MTTVSNTLVLREKQVLFVKLLAKLITFVYSIPNTELTLSEGFRSDGRGHMIGSLHYIRLAQDFNLFVDGVFVQNSDHPDFKVIGEYWESLDPLCRWGGRFNDANHFSLTHGGKS